MLIPFKDLFRRHHVNSVGCLHIGASSGQERYAYVEAGFRRVIWIEALPEVHAQLVANTANLRGHISLNACISDCDGEKVTFNVANNEGQSSSYLQFGTHAIAHPTTKFIKQIEMTTVRVDTLVNALCLRGGIGPDWFLNVDVQGAELKALRSLGKMIKEFKYAYVEVNNEELYKGCPLVGDIDAYFAEHGFVPKETKMTKHGWGDRFYVRA